jgi:PAS domain S-box-containing protein
MAGASQGGGHVRLRQIAPVGLVLGLTVAGFLGARALGERDARRDSERRADVAAAEIRGHVVQGAALAESLRRLMVGVADGGVAKEQFEGIASRWLSPAGLAAAAWIEQVPASRRATYERRIGRPISTRDRRGTVAPVPPRSSYLPATLVSGIAPMVVAGLDLGTEPGMTAAVARQRTLFDVSATSLSTLRDGTRGFFLVKSAQRLGRRAVEPGFVVVFVPESWLRAAATDTQRMQLTVGDSSSGDLEGVPAVRSAFNEAGQRFEVVVPRRSVGAVAAVTPWIILVSGFVLALLVGALGINAARRTSAQRELDRIFSLSHDLIAVVDFNGYFTRLNPAAERILGYTKDELLARPYLDFVHPDDRESTAAEETAIAEGKTTASFENRYVRKDDSERVLEWTATPVVEECVIYAAGRDVTERRKAEWEVERLAEEQAALRRVATLVAGGTGPDQVFAAVADEMQEFFGADISAVVRFEGDGSAVVVGGSGRPDLFPLGSHLQLEGDSVSSRVLRTGRPARIDDYRAAAAAGPLAETARSIGVRAAVGVPISVRGRLWGAISAGSTHEGPMRPDTEVRLAWFTELVATAIANAESAAELAASRRRIVGASDDARRRIERDLHDGVQQQLVSLGLELGVMEADLPAGDALREQLARVSHDVGSILEGLLEIAHGIHPAILSHGGLRQALKMLARRSAVPVELDAQIDVRVPDEVEVGAYYVASEALTNVAKHARASTVHIHVTTDDGSLTLAVRDDGVGGAEIGEGSGLVGLQDRVEALGGTIAVDSPEGKGTRVVVTLPLSTEPRPEIEEVLGLPQEIATPGSPA